MASNQRFNRAYGLDTALQNLAPRPILSQRAPLATDKLEIGTTWVDIPNQAVYVLVAIVANEAVWTTSPASGVGAFTSVTVNPGDVDVTAGNVNIPLGNLNMTNGNAIIGGNLVVTGSTTLNGDIDFASAALIDLVSTLDAAPSILLHANGGTSEQIQLHSDQGTSLTSVYLLSDVGGIKLYAPGLANDAAIALQADAGGIDMDSATQLSLTSTENAADAIEIVATAGGIDIVSGGAAGEDIDITASSSINLTSSEDAADAIYLHADAGTSETIRIHSDQGTGVDSITLISDVGGIALTSTGLVDNSSIALSSVAGGIIVTAASQVNIESSQAATDAILVNASNAAGGIDMNAGTGGIDINSVGGDVNITSSNDAADAIYLHANAGTSETIRLHADQGTGVDSVGLVSDVGGITLTSGLASDDAINLSATAGGIDIDGALQVNIASSEAAADAIVLSSSNAAGGIDLTTGGGSIDISSAGFVTMVAATDTQASPTAASTLNVNVGAATFTGFTTASGAAQVFTITNSIATTTSQIFVSISNEGANDAQMTVTRVNRAAGSFAVTATNNGAAALNGNVTVNFWIIG